MKIIYTPEYLENKIVGDATLTIDRNGITFNKVAHKILALDEKSEFAIVDIDKVLHYQELPEGSKGFKITSVMKSGAMRTQAKGMLQLITNNTIALRFTIEAINSGLRLLKPIRSTVNN